jgi:chromosomal replication initiation ATPase DnaA
MVPVACRWTTLLEGFEPSIPTPERYITPRHVLLAVAKVWDIQPKILVGARREVFVIIPRGVALALALHLTRRSTTKVGQDLNKDHSTVLSASRRMAPHITAVGREFGDCKCLMTWARALKARLEA